VSAALQASQAEAGQTHAGLIVASAEVWDRVVAQPGRVTLLPLFDDPDIALALGHDHHIILPIGQDQVSRGATIELPRPDRRGATDALEGARLSRDRAYQLSALARRSMPSLVRTLARDRRLARPPWTALPLAATFAPLVLVGAWTASDADTGVASRIVDKPWPEIERTLLAWALGDDPPFVRTGMQWHLASPEEAFLLLRDSLSPSDLGDVARTPVTDFGTASKRREWLHDVGRATYLTATDLESLDAFKLLSQLEGILPAIESCHALARLPERPKRSILFIAYFGEEKGLLGSRYYGAHPLFPLAQTDANFNLEQMGRTDDSEGQNVKRVSVTGFDYSNLTDWLVDAGRDTGIKFYKHEANSDSFFGRSDNQSLADSGVPSHTLVVAFMYPDYHQPGDHWEKIDYDNMAEVTRAIGVALVRVANSPKPVEWNTGNPKAADYVKAAKGLAAAH